MDRMVVALCLAVLFALYAVGSMRSGRDQATDEHAKSITVSAEAQEFYRKMREGKL